MTLSGDHILSSLIVSSHRPVIDCLQYAKTEGRGRPGLFYHVNDVSVYRYRDRRGKKVFQSHILHLEPGAFFASQTFETPALGAEITR